MYKEQLQSIHSKKAEDMTNREQISKSGKRKARRGKRGRGKNTKKSQNANNSHLEQILIKSKNGKILLAQKIAKRQDISQDLKELAEEFLNLSRGKGKNSNSKFHGNKNIFNE